MIEPEPELELEIEPEIEPEIETEPKLELELETEIELGLDRARASITPKTATRSNNTCKSGSGPAGKTQQQQREAIKLAPKMKVFTCRFNGIQITKWIAKIYCITIWKWNGSRVSDGNFFFFLSMNPFTCDRLNEPIFFFPLSLQEVIHLLQ